MLLFDVLVIAGIVSIFGFLRALERFGKRDDRFHLFLFVGLEIVFHQLEAFLRIIVPVEEDERIGRMVIGLPEVPEIFVGQVGDVARIAARVAAVDVFGEQRLDHARFEDAVRRGVRALHFVEDHALVGERLAGIVDLVMPALLHQGLLADQRMQDRVDVDIDQVVEILHVLARHRIACFVGERERVDKGSQRAFEQLHERFLDRILLGTVQYGMLEDMRHTGRIFGRGAEVDAEHFVFVVVEYG
jgi:hypothetical protein